jgi:hypothetical protein
VIVRSGTHVPINKGNGSNSILTRLPEPGNISAVTEWSLTGLENGVYEWRLRAVDAAYAGSDIAAGQFNIGVSSIDDSDNIIPGEYSLEQNYPNPFNPVTMINFSIPNEDLVTLKIYNTIGEEIETLINEMKQAGNYNVSFNASSLPSGIYFYRLQAGDFLETKKMILLR